MKSCPEFEETLLLDVHAELGPEERRPWEQHLGRCPACREARQQTLELLGRVKKAAPEPRLAPEQARELSLLAQRAARRRGGRFTPSRLLGRQSWRLVPAFALAAAVLSIGGWLAVHSLTDFFGPPAALKLAPDVEVAGQELEIIRNLDLLEDLDALQRLVRVVDHRSRI